MNRVDLVGRLARDPELRHTTSGRAVCQLTVAVSRNFTNQNGEREADFIPVIVWRKQAENVKNYLTQGSQVAIDGRIQTRSYDDQQGQKRYVTEVIADNVEFLGSKGTSNNVNNSSNTESNPTPYDFESTPKGTDVESNPFADFGEEDPAEKKAWLFPLLLLQNMVYFEREYKKEAHSVCVQLLPL